MAEVVKPFKATYYNLKVIKDYSKVICPPYDVISKEQLKALRKKSPYNFSHILIADKGYDKAAAKLNQFIRDDVLVRDEKESLYFYEQKYQVQGKKFARYGILSLLKMDKNGIFPHERTLKGPKEDRKKIIKTTKANLSPIFIIAGEALKIFDETYKSYRRKKPFLKFQDDNSVVNRIWKIQEPKEVNKICKEIEKCNLVIADGHHRFEISYDYFKKNQGKFKDLNYILAYIADCQKGLLILPTHRIASLDEKKDVLFEKLAKYFTINSIREPELEKSLKKPRTFSFGIYYKAKFYVVRLKEPKLLNKLPKKVYKEIDPYVFHNLVEPMIKLKASFEYTHTIKEAKKTAGKNKMAFILNPVSLDSVLKISAKGFKLPQKSTYFYPKVLSGAIIRRFEP